MKQIMIVEDDCIIAFHLSSLLRKWKYKVSEVVNSGNEAIQKVKDDKPDLILMDISLRENIDGIEATKEIHKLLDIPIIYLTAVSDAVTLKQIRTTDHSGIVNKPFDEEVLQTTIEQALTCSKFQLETSL